MKQITENIGRFVEYCTLEDTVTQREEEVAKAVQCISTIERYFISDRFLFGNYVINGLGVLFDIYIKNGGRCEDLYVLRRPIN